MINITQAIERHDSNAWAFIFSDHGYGVFKYGIYSQEPWTKERFDTTFRILNVIKAPPNCTEELARRKSSVNKARAILSCLSSGSKLPYLPEQVDLFHLKTKAKYTIYEDHYERVP